MFQGKTKASPRSRSAGFISALAPESLCACVLLSHLQSSLKPHFLMGNFFNKGEVLPHPPENGGWSRNRELKVACEGRSIYLEGAEREPFANVFFRLDCTGNERHTKVQLTMDQVDFGVRNSCTRNCSEKNEPCGKNCKTPFIYKVMIEVIPKSWAQDSRRLLLQPYPTPEVFGLQRSVTLGCQMPLDPRNGSVTYLRARTVSSTALQFGWSPARADNSSNSVSWTWELYRYINGRKLQFNRTRWGTRPLLGIRPDQIHIHPGSFLAEASWELKPNAEVQQQQLQWDVKVDREHCLRTGCISEESFDCICTRYLQLVVDPSI